MALGDYEKTTYVNGQAPGISAQNLNKNEDKTAELDTELKTHLADNASPHQYEDEGEDPEFEGVKYRLVVIDGEPFLQVVEVPE